MDSRSALLLFVACLMSLDLSSSERPSLKLTNLPVIKKKLSTPSLEEIRVAFSLGFSRDFFESEVEIVDCPDLGSPPYDLGVTGLGKEGAVLSIGRQKYIFEGVCEKIYDLRTIPELTGIEPASILGAASGPYQYVGGLSEMMIESVALHGGIIGRSKVARVGAKNESIIQDLLPSEHRACFIVDIFCSDGLQDKVIRIHAKKRLTDNDIVTTMRNHLAKSFSSPVGMGCVFRVLKGTIRNHVQPPYFPEDTSGTTQEVNNRWLKFYNFTAPQIAYGTLISKYPGTDEATRLSHVHSYKQGSGSEGGHFYGDTAESKDVAEYEILCSPPARFVYQVD